MDNDRRISKQFIKHFQFFSTNLAYSLKITCYNRSIVDRVRVIEHNRQYCADLTSE